MNTDCGINLLICFVQSAYIIGFLYCISKDDNSEIYYMLLFILFFFAFHSYKTSGFLSIGIAAC